MSRASRLRAAERVGLQSSQHEKNSLSLCEARGVVQGTMITKVTCVSRGGVGMGEVGKVGQIALLPQCQPEPAGLWLLGVFPSLGGMSGVSSL